MKKLKVGIVGMGFIGVQQLEAIRRIPGAEVAAVCASSEEKTRAAQEKYFVDKGYADFKKLIEDPEIEIIHNCTPNFLHDEVNRAAIEAGKHIYAEKPLSDSAQTAREMFLLAHKAGVAHGVNHQYRMNAAVIEMRERVQKGECGKILMARGHYLQESQCRQTDLTKRLLNFTGPARALSDIGIHWVDTMSSVLGCPVTSVMADLQQHFPYRIHPETGEKHEMKTEDCASVLMRFADGTPGMMVASKTSCGSRNDLSLSLDAEKCGLTWNQEAPGELKVGLRGEPSKIQSIGTRFCRDEVKPYVSLPDGHQPGWADALKNAIWAYYDSIWKGTWKNEKQPYATFLDGFYGMAFVEACLRSQKEGRWAQVEKV